MHAAHVEVACRAREQLELGEIWFVPAFQPPHKVHRTLVDAEHRLAMLQLAMDGRDGLAICTIEIEDRRVHTTESTLGALRAAHPGLAFALILGQDSFAQLDTWARPDRLAQHIEQVAVCPRPGGDARRPGFWRHIPVHWLQGEPQDVSSSAIRDALQQERATDRLPDGVQEYIAKHGLYRERRP